jgi:site-specific recombinase XerD
MQISIRNTNAISDLKVVTALAKQLTVTQRNPADLLAIPEYRDNRNLLLNIAIASFLQSVSNESTRKDYRKALHHFSIFLHQTRDASLLDAVGWDVAAWREDLSETGGMLGTLPDQVCRRRPNSPSSIETKTSALSSFYEYLAKPGFYDNSLFLIPSNPVSALPTRHKGERYGKSQKIGLKAFKAILNQIKLSTVKGLRDYALLYGYYITGRRHSVWVNLQWQNIDWNSSIPVYTYVGKGQKSFRDVMPKTLIKVLTAYLRGRWGEKFKRKLRPGTYLFTSLQPRHQHINEPLVESSVLRLIKGYAQKADLSQPERTIIHSLRHLHAETYLQAGANVETIRSRLQHQNLDTTQVYASTMDSQKNPLADKLAERLKEG